MVIIVRIPGMALLETTGSALLLKEDNGLAFPLFSDGSPLVDESIDHSVDTI